MKDLSTRLFSYYADTGTFATEAELRDPGRLGRADEQEAGELDAGGEPEVRRLDRVEKDSEGDVQAWHYRPVVATNPFGPVTVTIWND